MARIRGVSELKRDLRKLPAELRKEAAGPVKESTTRMHLRVRELLASAASYAPLWHGGAGMQDITGTARRSYRKSISRDGLTGRVGQLSSGAERAGFYLAFFFNGTVHQPARPAHDEAFEAERDIFIRNEKKALDRVLARLP